MGKCSFKRLNGKFLSFWPKMVYTVDLFNEYMKIYEYESSRSFFFIFNPDTQSMTLSKLSILKSHQVNCNHISHSLLGLREQIFVQTVKVT